MVLIDQPLWVIKLNLLTLCTKLILEIFLINTLVTVLNFYCASRGLSYSLFTSRKFTRPLLAGYSISNFLWNIEFT